MILGNNKKNRDHIRTPLAAQLAGQVAPHCLDESSHEGMPAGRAAGCAPLADVAGKRSLGAKKLIRY